MQIVIAKTFRQKLIGLMGVYPIKKGMLFYNVKSIHTFFMKDTIDIIGLDYEYIVKEIYPNVRPNHILFLRKSKHTLELPKGSFKKYHLGQKLKI